MRIGFISYETPFDRSSFSGTLFYMFNALNAQPMHSVTAIGHAKSAGSFSQKIYPKLLRFCQLHLPKIAQKLVTFKKNKYVKQVQHAVDSGKFDVFIAPVSSDIIAALRLEPNNAKLQKIIFITDATPSYIAQEYQYSPNPKSHAIEKSCIKKSFKSLYSSHFMANMARDEFKKIPQIEQKISVVRFGLNLDNPPQTITTKKYPSTINLVFVGKEWERKGGAIAVATVNALNEKGVACHLTLIGCKPPQPLDSQLFTVIPFLNKNIECEQAQYQRIMSQAHFLLLPTRADCTPMVIAEANAFSCPALTSDVGGIPSLINNGENGFLLPLTATAADYANTIQNALINPEQYQQLCTSSFMFYQTHLTWKAWAKNLLEYVN